MKRGDYAAIHTALIDDLDFQNLSPDARLLWFYLRLLLGASGIAVIRSWPAVLADLTRIPDLRNPMDELVDGNWLMVQENVFWLRNVLKFNPNLNLSHKKHLAGVVKHIDGLPKLAIVNAFAEYYGVDAPFSDVGNEWLSKGYRKAIEWSSVRTTDYGLRTADTGQRTTVTCSDEHERSLDVENWSWGDFAGWYRTTGRALLWMGDEPPGWANEGEPWTLERDLSIAKRLEKKGESFAVIKGVIERNREPTCMLRFNQLGRWDYWEKAKAEWRKAEEMKGLGPLVTIGDRKGVANG